MTNQKNIMLEGNRQLNFKQFQLSQMVENPAIVMIAKRGSGKSWICRSILKHFRDVPIGLVIAPTEKMANPAFYSEFVPDLYIHYEYNSDLISKLLIRQDHMIEKQKQKAAKGKHIDPRAFLLMDDCLSTKGTWMKDQTITELLFNGRHYRVMYILTMQFPLGITPELRGNFDYVFLLKDSNFSNQKRLYDHYAGMFPNFESFRQVFNELTKDFGSLVISNRGSQADIFDQVFWYKANNEKVGLIGCKQYIKFHQNNYDENWRQKKKTIGINDIYGKKSNDNTIKITKIGNEDESYSRSHY